MSKKSGYYDFEFDFAEVIDDRGTVEELLYVKDLKQRKFFLTTEIG